MAIEVQCSPSKPTHYQGKPIQIAQLQTINFSRLLSQEPAELDKLLHLCKTEGFFYLDLQDINGRRMLDDKARLLKVMERFFNSTHDEKNEIGLPSQEHGYEPVGNHAGVVDGTKDGYEILKVGSLHPSTFLIHIVFSERLDLTIHYLISTDELSKGSSIALPSILKNDHDIKVFDDFVAGSSITTKTMLSALSTALGLQGRDRFENSHRNNHKSNSTLAMFRYIPGDITISKEVGHQKHTDIGSLTLLFSEQWDLQVQRPGPENHEKWEFIEPRPVYAVINVGDSLRFASGHQLYSCIHQVVPINSSEHRYSIVYFLSPEDEAKYKDSNGRWVTAREWRDAKYEVFQKEHQQQVGSDSILMGGMEMAASA